MSELLKIERVVPRELTALSRYTLRRLLLQECEVAVDQLLQHPLMAGVAEDDPPTVRLALEARL